MASIYVSICICLAEQKMYFFFHKFGPCFIFRHCGIIKMYSFDTSIVWPSIVSRYKNAMQMKRENCLILGHLAYWQYYKTYCFFFNIFQSIYMLQKNIILMFFVFLVRKPFILYKILRKLQNKIVLNACTILDFVSFNRVKDKDAQLLF